jgi:branched-chain amino acid transport system permease protein
MWGGIVTGSAYAVLALGFTLIFGVLRILQFAHPAIFVTGAFIGFAVGTHISANFIVVLLAAMAATAVAGVLVQQFSLRPLRDSYFLTPAVSTIAAGIVVQNLIITVWGPEPQFFPAVVPFTTYRLSGVDFAMPALVVVGASLVMMVGLKLLVDRTKAGRAMRAAAEKPEVAQILGVNTKRVATATMAGASALAGAAGVLVATLYGTITPFMEASFGFKGLVIMIVGGLGSIGGAMFAGVALGVVETLATQYISSSYRDAFAYGLLMLVLIFKPTGLFGRIDPKKV